MCSAKLVKTWLAFKLVIHRVIPSRGIIESVFLDDDLARYNDEKEEYETEMHFTQESMQTDGICVCVRTNLEL